MAETSIPLVVKVWAGSEAHDFDYISRSLPSLLRSDLPAGVQILVFDDASTDERLAPFLSQLAKSDPRLRLFPSVVNKGPNAGQADAFTMVESEYPHAPYFLTVDDDVVYHRGWLTHLLQAREELLRRGIDGVFSALNMPFRRAHRIEHTSGSTCLLKWRQPALNWLIPRRIYRDVGPFADEGIAYDTAYSHRLRLNGYSVICLSPSLVQNIGTFGAYSRDQSTTADDFLGEGRGDSVLVGSLRRSWRRLARPFRRQSPDIAPIRWGAEWVYEQQLPNGVSTATMRLADAAPLGWSTQALSARVEEVHRAQASGPFALLHTQLAVSDLPNRAEFAWRCLPSLYEARRYPSRYGSLDPAALSRAIVRDLMPLHRSGVVHNKIRPANLYIEEHAADGFLAWYGHEPASGRPVFQDRESALARFGNALDRRASAVLRERAAVAYLSAVAPEVAAGGNPTPRSDVFAAAALVWLSLVPEPRTFAELETLRSGWPTGLGLSAAGVPAGLARLLTVCLSADPSGRPATALDLHAALSRI